MAAIIKRYRDEIISNTEKMNEQNWFGDVYDKEELRRDIKRLQDLIASLSGGKKAPVETEISGTPTSEIIEESRIGPATLGDFSRPPGRDMPTSTITRQSVRDRGSTFNNVSLVQQAHANWKQDLGKYNTVFARNQINPPRATLEEQEGARTALGDMGLGGTLPRDI